MTTIAIDFGSSNTVVCLINPDTKLPESLRFNDISRIFKMTRGNGEIMEIPVIPTLAFVAENHQLILGEKVRSQRLGQAQPHRYFKLFKRDLAADFQPPPRQIDEITYTPEFISEEFIKAIWQELKQQKIHPTRLIFTVPVGAFERYLDWFRDLAVKLGVDDVQLVDESTAAALGYAVKRPGSLVLVVDFGGGTLDLSLVRTALVSPLDQGKQGGVRAEVLAKSDAYVGGEDIDIWLVEAYLKKMGLSRDDVGKIGWQNLLEIAEKLKIKLSRNNEAKEAWFDDENFMSHELHLTRDQFEIILENRQLLGQLREALDDILSIGLGKGINKSEIEQVLLVGGTCLIPAIQNLVISYFGRQKVRMNKPFEAVAHGALWLNDFEEIDDYLRHSYAIRLWEPHAKTYSYSLIFEKGMKYPCKTNQPLTLQVALEGQQEIRLDIGELAEISHAEVIFNAQGQMTSSFLHKNNEFRSLESHHEQVCVAHLTPPGQIGIDRVSVEFEVNEQRVLLATVRDLMTGMILVERGAIAKLQ